MSPIQPLAVLGGITAAATGAAAKVATGGNAFLKALVGAEPAASQPPPLSAADKEQRLQLKLKEFGDRIRERLTAAGIDVSQPIELEISPTGGIAVVGGHPDMVRIEAVLNDLPGAGGELAALLDDGGAKSLALAEKDATLVPREAVNAFAS